MSVPAVRRCGVWIIPIAEVVADMTMLKVIEVLTESDKSWEDAAQNAIREAGKTVRNIKSIYIKDFEATVEGDRIVNYRVNAKISFMLE